MKPVPADLASIFPDADQEVMQVPEVPVPETPTVGDVREENPEPDDAANELPEPELPASRENIEQVGERSKARPLRRTYEDSFMEEVRNLREERERRKPRRFEDDDCMRAELLTSEIDEPKSLHEALNSKESVQWQEAVNAEYSSLMKNDTWELVPPPKDKNIVGSRWVLKVKRDENGAVDRFKARFVAQGYSQMKGIDYDEVFSPVARYASVRSLLALANAHDLEIHQMDVKTAFLNGSLNCEIYMSQPEGFVDPERPDYVCKLKKSIYGLKQSARCWNTTLDEYLKCTGYHKSNADGCIYTKSKKAADGHISYVILGVYVDDLVPVSNDPAMLKEEKQHCVTSFKWWIRERSIIYSACLARGTES